MNTSLFFFYHIVQIIKFQQAVLNRENMLQYKKSLMHPPKTFYEK